MQCNSVLCSQAQPGKCSTGAWDGKMWPEAATSACCWHRAASGQTLPPLLWVVPEVLNSHSCFQEEHARIQELDFPSPWPPSWPRVRDRLLTQVRTLTNPSISFWNQSVRARLRKTVHFDALWSYGELDLVLRLAPALFRKHARRNMSFISPFRTHSFTRNSRNESKVERCLLCTQQSVSIWTDVLPSLSPSTHTLAWLN